MNARLARLGAAQFAALLALVTLCTRASGFFVSFYSGDEATYSALARRILGGAIPYASAVDHKPVGIELVYAGLYALPGHLGLRGIRALFLVIVWATALMLGKLAARLSIADGLDDQGGRRIGRVAALAYVLASAWGFASDVQAANTELLLNLPLAAAALLCLRAAQGRAPFSSAALAGALVGLAGLCKYQSALVGGAFAAFAFFRGTRGAKLPTLFGLALGFGVIAVAYVGAFALSGHWDAFVYWGWQFNFSYMSVLSTRLIAENALTRSAWILVIWSPLWIGLVRAPRTRSSLFTDAWMVAAAVAVTFGGRFFSHYYLMGLAPLAIASAPGLVRLFDRAPRATKVLVGLGAIATVASLVMAWGWYALKPRAQALWTVYSDVGRYLHEHGEPDDRVFVWGNSPEIYELSGLRMGTRFVFCNYHTGLIWGSPFYDDNAPGAEAHIVPRAWTELLADLHATPPRFFVDAATGGLDHFERHGIARYAPLKEFVDGSYVLADTIDGVPIYRRR